MVSTPANRIDIQTNQLWFHKWMTSSNHPILVNPFGKFLFFGTHFAKTRFFFIEGLESCWNLVHCAMKSKEGRSLAETPTWAVGTVISLLVAIGFLLHGCLKKLGQVNIDFRLFFFFSFYMGICVCFYDSWSLCSMFCFSDLHVVCVQSVSWYLKFMFIVVFWENTWSHELFNDFWVYCCVCSGWIGLKGSIFLLRWTKSRKVRRDEFFYCFFIAGFCMFFSNFGLLFYWAASVVWTRVNGIWAPLIVDGSLDCFCGQNLCQAVGIDEQSILSMRS